MTNPHASARAAAGVEQSPLRRVSVVIPVRNEAANVRPLYLELKATLEALPWDYEVLFVEDGSDDGTRRELEELVLADPHLHAILLKGNFGQTAALAAGFDQAQGDVIVTMDGDLQNDPADLPRLLAKLDEGYDVVSGWRKNRKDPWLGKRLPSALSNALASRLTGVKLHDYGCTLKAYRREVVAQVNLYGELHRYIPALASAVGARIAEVEVRHRPRRHGRSKYGTGRLARGLLDLVTVKLLLSYSTRPMQIFGGVGLLLLGLGGLCALATLLMKLLGGVDMTGNPLLYLALLSLIMGVQFISLGFLAELNIRTYHETQNKPIYVVERVLTRKPVQQNEEVRASHDTEA